MNVHATSPDFHFRVEGAEAVRYAAAPLLALKLRIDASESVPIHSILLRCQVNIEVARRRYNGEEQDRLFDLFGRPQDWGRTLRSLLWTQANVSVPAFTGSTLVDLPLACTYDFNVAAVKYFDALEDGEVPLCLLFNGTVFYATPQNALQVAQIPWEKEAAFRLPVRAWREMMDLYYPNMAWVEIRKDVFDRLHAHKRNRGHLSWDQTMECLLAMAAAGAGSAETGSPSEAGEDAHPVLQGARAR